MKTNDPASWSAAETSAVPASKMYGQCKQCKALLIGGRKDRKFCNAECAGEFQRLAWRQKNPKSPLAALQNNTKAEANIMKVCIDLLQRGYEVYKAAFQGMPCDLVVIYRQETSFGSMVQYRRIEVTSGNRSTSGTLSHPKREAAQYDVLAVVVGDEIFYKPELITMEGA